MSWSLRCIPDTVVREWEEGKAESLLKPALGNITIAISEAFTRCPLFLKQNSVLALPKAGGPNVSIEHHSSWLFWFALVTFPVMLGREVQLVNVRNRSDA